MRTALRGRYLAIFRSTLIDGGGRTVATHVLGAIGGTNGTTGAADLGADIRQIARDLTSSSTWHVESADAHAAMMRRRIERTHAIAASLAGSNAPLQPGLFERRAEHAWQHESQSSEAARMSAVARSARAELGLTLHLSNLEPVLLLGSDAR